MKYYPVIFSGGLILNPLLGSLRNNQDPAGFFSWLSSWLPFVRTMNFKSFVFPGFQPTDTRMCGCFVRIFWEGKTSPWLFWLLVFCAMGKTHFAFFLKGFFFLSIANVGRIRDARGCNHLLPLDSRRRTRPRPYKLMEGLRPAVDASKQLGLSCGAREGLRKWRSSGPRFPRTNGMSRFWCRSTVCICRTIWPKRIYAESGLGRRWEGISEGLKVLHIPRCFAHAEEPELGDELDLHEVPQEESIATCWASEKGRFPKKRWHLGWWKDFFHFLLVGFKLTSWHWIWGKHSKDFETWGQK